MNDLYCYFMWIGPWKEFSPPEIIVHKRRLDRILYANRPFFPTATMEAYESFAHVLFRPFIAPGADAQLRTAVRSANGDRAAAYTGSWLPEWAALFVSEQERTSWHDVRARHEALLDRLGADVSADDRMEARP